MVERRSLWNFFCRRYTISVGLTYMYIKSRSMSFVKHMDVLPSLQNSRIVIILLVYVLSGKLISMGGGEWKLHRAGKRWKIKESFLQENYDRRVGNHIPVRAFPPPHLPPQTTSVPASYIQSI